MRVTEAESQYLDRITICWCWKEGWHMEILTKFKANVLRLTIKMGKKQWYVVAAYIPLGDMEAKK